MSRGSSLGALGVQHGGVLSPSERVSGRLCCREYSVGGGQEGRRVRHVVVGFLGHIWNNAWLQIRRNQLYTVRFPLLPYGAKECKNERDGVGVITSQTLPSKR